MLKQLKPYITKRYIYGYLYTFLSNTLPVRKRYILLESHHGTDFFGNPFYLAKSLSKSNEYKQYKLIIVAPKNKSNYLRKVLASRKLTIVPARSLRYIFYLACCKWLVSDVTFPLYFSRRKEQCYLNTWHGTPLKTLGIFSNSEKSKHLVNIQRNFFHSNIILAPNSHTKQTLINSYCLHNHKINYLDLGYPRNDVLIQTKNNKENIVDIAFMPTWRGSLTNRQEESISQLKHLHLILNNLDTLLPENFNLWIKLHPLIHGAISITSSRRIKKFPDNTETYEHLAKCDILITDYSSVMFDFAATRRPIIRFIDDQDEYTSERGFCLSLNEVPFPVANSVEQLVDAIICAINEKQSISDEFIDKFNNLDNGLSAANVLEHFLEQSSNQEPFLVAQTRKKQNILVFFGKNALSKDYKFYEEIFSQLDTCEYNFTIAFDAEWLDAEWENKISNHYGGLSYIAMQFSPYILPSDILNYIYSPQKSLMSFREREFKRLFGNHSFEGLVDFEVDGFYASIIQKGFKWQFVKTVNNKNNISNVLNALENLIIARQ